MEQKSIVVREGYTIIIPTAILTCLTALFGFYWIAFALFLLAAFFVFFFRNPEREIPNNKMVVVSPADGRIIKIENVVENSLLEGQYKKISIFMNIFNVHVNRIPYAGEIEKIIYKPGKLLSANMDKASALNERNLILIKTAEGKKILTIQIAGIIARRISCWLREGMHVKRGERFGLIKFGSRLEVYLPSDSKIVVESGNKVKAGETPLGYLNE
jgi:phosphatidylserine decarboxylase